MIRDIPPTRLATCVFCADRLDITDASVYQHASGWTRNRNRGNSLTLTKHHRRWACSECINRLQHGVAVGQVTIFDAMTESDDDIC